MNVRELEETIKDAGNIPGKCLNFLNEDGGLVGLGVQVALSCHKATGQRTTQRLLLAMVP